jgi:hypothetical protein
MLIDGARTSQLPYVTQGAAHREHDDDVVHRVHVIDANLASALRISDLAHDAG